MAQIQGRYALTYEGVNAPTPPNFIFETRPPTPNDYIGIDIGTIWLNQIQVPGSTPTYDTSQPFMLVAKARNFGTWIGIGSGSSGPEGDIVKVQSFITPGAYTYTPSTGITSVLVEVIGAGGGSGGAISAANGYCNATGGAGAGAYAKSFYTAATIGASQTVIVGSGGLLAVAGALGGTGGTSSFGALITCTGGVGSQLASATAVGQPGGVGGTATGGNIVNVTGQSGNISSVFTQSTQSFASSGMGGSTMYGAGGSSVANSNLVLAVGVAGNPGIGYGGGASGSASAADSMGVNPDGAAGFGGLVLVTEFI